CAALSVIAALLRPGESDSLTDAIEERRPRIDAECVVLAVDAQRNRDGALDARSFRSFRGRGALHGSAVRVRRCARGHDRGRRRGSRGEKERPTGWFRRARWRIVWHGASVESGAYWSDSGEGNVRECAARPEPPRPAKRGEGRGE